MYIASGTIEAYFMKVVRVIERDPTSKSAAHISYFYMEHVLCVHDLSTKTIQPHLHRYVCLQLDAYSQWCVFIYRIV